MPNFDIDSLKKTWQEQPIPTAYEQEEIQQMLHKKSRNYVRYIWIISLAEFLLFLILGISYLFSNTDTNDLIFLIQKMNLYPNEAIQQQISLFMNIMKFTGLGISFAFMVRFYFNYKNIKVNDNLKNFILRIKKSRGTVNQFIIVNFILFFIHILGIIFFISRLSYLQKGSFSTPFLVFFGITALIGAGVLWLYYRIIYGIIMKKLNRNLTQLKEIETTETK